MATQHLPRPGYGRGLTSVSYCGRHASFLSGDHALILRQARDTQDESGYCPGCLAAMRADDAGQPRLAQIIASRAALAAAGEA